MRVLRLRAPRTRSEGTATGKNARKFAYSLGTRGIRASVAVITPSDSARFRSLVTFEQAFRPDRSEECRACRVSFHRTFLARGCLGSIATISTQFSGALLANTNERVTCDWCTPIMSAIERTVFRILCTKRAIPRTLRRRHGALVAARRQRTLLFGKYLYFRHVNLKMGLRSAE